MPDISQARTHFDSCERSSTNRKGDNAVLGQNPEPLLTITDACRLFNLKPHVMRRAIKRGELKTYRIGNRRIRVRASDIEALILASVGGAK